MIGLTAFLGTEHRVDYEAIINLVPKGSRILDVGCGEGDLLKRLIESKNVTARGLELFQQSVNIAVANKLSVIQGDAERDLSDYHDATFDYLIISQAIQTMQRPDLVLNEALRIGNNVIVSLPNFGYWRVRLHLLFKGEMPVTSSLPYSWFDTPNIHFCTINDFINYCQKNDISIEKSIYLNSSGKPIRTVGMANIFAEQAVMVLKRL